MRGINKLTLVLVLGMILFVHPNAWPQETLTFEEAYKLYNEQAEKGDFAAALPYAKRAYETGTVIYGSESANTGALAYNYGLSALNAGVLDVADLRLLESLIIFEKNYGTRSLGLLDPLMELARLKELQNNRSAAVTFLQRASLLLNDQAEDEKIFLAEVNMRLGNLLLIGPEFGTNRIQQAIYYFNKSDQIYSEVLGDDSHEAGFARFTLAKAHTARKDNAGAENYFLKALDAWENNSKTDPALRIEAHRYLVGLFEGKGEDGKATDHSIAAGLLLNRATVDGSAPLYSVNPDYPTAALYSRAEGEFSVEFTVSEEGRVLSPRVLTADAPQAFADAVMAAIVKFRYAPAVRNGKLVATDNVKYNFIFDLDR